MQNMQKLQSIAQFILDEAVRLGADTAQCSVMETRTLEFNVDGGAFSLLRTLFDRYVSVTVLRAHRQGSVTVNRFDEDAVRAAVADCLAAADGAEPDEAREYAPGPVERDFTLGTPEPDREALFARTREFMGDAAARHPKLLMEQLITYHHRTQKVYMNTNGVTYRTLSGSYELGMTYSAHDGEESTAMYGGSLTTRTLDRPFIDCALIDREMGEVEAQLGATPLTGKFTGTAVFAPQCLAGDVFAQALSNFASDTALLEGTSPWRDSLGKPVADERVTLALAPNDDRLVSFQRYTGEGYPAEDCHILKNGVLESFWLTQYGANRTGFTRAGNTSLSMIVEPGDAPLADIIAGIERGVYLMRFSGGQPAASGEFSGVAKNGFLIENGRLTRPLTETMISGNLADMLKNVRAVSRETLSDGDVVMPYMAFDGVTVSGK